LAYFVVIWYIFPRFGILYQEKSGNPALADCFLAKEAEFCACASIKMHFPDAIWNLLEMHKTGLERFAGPTT
jgi:hypothetical protein